MNLIKKTLLSIAVLLPVGVSAQSYDQPMPVDKAVRIGTLDNGLKYYIRYNNWPEKRADFYIAQRVGSIQEEESQRGLAHFLEHMCFNGTDHFKDDALLRYCESLGVKFGADLNAYTSIDQTVYNISNVPTMRQSALDSCLLILHDWSHALTLDTKEIDKERGVIHEEWRTRISANQRMLERNLPKVYAGSKYGDRFPIGLMSVVDNFKPKELRDYYEKWYHPSNQGIIVVGDVDVDHIEAEIKRLFGKLKNPDNMAPVVNEPVPDNETPVVIVDKDKEQPNSAVEVMFKHEVWPDSLKGSKDYVMRNYIRGLAVGMLNDRMAEASQKPDCPYIGASASDGSFIFAKTKGAFSLSAAPRSMDQTPQALKAIVMEARRAAKFGFTQEEYDRAKANVLSGLDRAYANRDKRTNASFAEDYKGNYLSNEPIPSFEDYYEMMKEEVPQVPLERINEVLPSLLPESGERNMIILNFNTEKEGSVYPTEASLLEAVREARSAELKPYVDNVKNEPLLTKLPKPGKIVKEIPGKKFDYKELILSNGVKVVLKKTDYKKDQIILSASGHGGKSLYGPADYLNLSVFNQVIASSGLGKFSRMDLPKVLAGKVASGRLTMGDKYMSSGGSSSRKDVETMLQLLYLYFTDIRKDQQSYEALIDSWRLNLANRELSHETIFDDSLTATVYGHDPRLKPVLVTDLDNINYDRILQIAKERTANAAGWTFMFTGDFDEAELRPLICRYLASLPKKGKVVKGKLTKHFEKGIIDNTFTRKMETPKAMAYMFWHTTDVPYTVDNAIKMNMIGQILSMVYLKKIREEAGAAYSCGAEGGSTLEGDYHDCSLLVTCPVKPEKKDLAIKIMQEEAEVMTHTCDESMLKKVKEYMLKNYDNALKTNGYWMNVVNMYRKYGMDVHTGYRELVSGQTPEGLCDMMKQLLKSGNRISVVMMPEE